MTEPPVSPPPGAPGPELLALPRAYVRLDRRLIARFEALQAAIDSFRPPEHPAGAAVAAWLRDRALTEPQEAAVYLRLTEGRISGVYALAATSVMLSRRDRDRLGDVHFRTQPGILVAQFARAVDSPQLGDELLHHADATARRALAYIAATVLVVDPFDPSTARMWQERFGFRASAQPVIGEPSLRRLWLPLSRD